MNLKLKTIAGILCISLVPIQFGYAVAGCLTTTMAEFTPTARFTLNNTDGTVLDTETDLVWKSCLEGQTWNSGTNSCDGVANLHSWKDALSVAESSIYASQSDWRLPNVKELISIVEFRCYGSNGSAINKNVFKGTGLSAWSSTPYLRGNLVNPGEKALRVNFYYGDIFSDTKDSTFKVRLVRN